MIQGHVGASLWRFESSQRHTFSSPFSHYTATDLRAPAKPAVLTDYFEPEEILKALLNDPLVKKSLETLPLPITDS